MLNRFRNVVNIVRNSVRLKLILGVAIVHLALMTAFIVDLVDRQQEFLIQEASRRAVNHAALIADTSSSWVIADDLVGMEEVLRSSAASGNLRYAMIVDTVGRVLSHTNPAMIGRYLLDDVSASTINGERKPRLIASDSNTIYAASPIMADQHLIGWSFLGLDTTATNVHLEYVTRTGLLYTVVAILIGTILAIFLARSFLRQLSLLLVGVDHMAQNRLDKPVPVIRADEVGKVTVALNAAMKSLDEGRVKLESEMSERRKAEEDIRHLSRRLIGTIEDERKRIAQDLHDEFGQALTALQFGLKALESDIPKGARDRCHELAISVERMGSNVDRIASDLRPAILDHLGLIPAVRSYIDELSQRAINLKIDLQVAGFKRRVDPSIELVCYRVIQEGVTNIIRHAHATHASIQLTMSHPKVILVVKDDGQGFNSMGGGATLGADGRGVGLSGMRERVVSVGGTFEIRSTKTGGTMIRAELPSLTPALHD